MDPMWWSFSVYAHRSCLQRCPSKPAGPGVAKSHVAGHECSVWLWWVTLTAKVSVPPPPTFPASHWSCTAATMPIHPAPHYIVSHVPRCKSSEEPAPQPPKAAHMAPVALCSMSAFTPVSPLLGPSQAVPKRSAVPTNAYGGNPNQTAWRGHLAWRGGVGVGAGWSGLRCTLGGHWGQ